METFLWYFLPMIIIYVCGTTIAYFMWVDSKADNYTISSRKVVVAFVSLLIGSVIPGINVVIAVLITVFLFLYVFDND